jgi:hypothetical protein
MPEAPAEAENLPARVTFFYIKSNQFRVIRVDGAHGGVTPRLQIQMALYSERLPIPQQAIHELKDGKLVEPAVDQIGKEGIVREVEVEGLMDVDTAKSLVAWLTDCIARAEKVMKEGR